MKSKTWTTSGFIAALMIVVLGGSSLSADPLSFAGLTRGEDRASRRAALFRTLNGGETIDQAAVSSMGSYEYADRDRCLWIGVSSSDRSFDLVNPDGTHRYVHVTVRATDFSAPSDVQYIDALLMTLEDYARIFASAENQTMHIPAISSTGMEADIEAETIGGTRVVRVTSTPLPSHLVRWRKAQLTFTLRDGRFSALKVVVLSRSAGSPLIIDAKDLDPYERGLRFHDSQSGQERLVVDVEEMRELLE